MRSDYAEDLCECYQLKIVSTVAVYTVLLSAPTSGVGGLIPTSTVSDSHCASRYSGFIPQSKDLTGISTLSLMGVYVRRSVQGVPCFESHGTGFRFPVTLHMSVFGSKNKWMNSLKIHSILEIS